MPRPLFLLLLMSAFSLLPRDGAAQVRRCVTPEGKAVFTDRACADIGSVERLPRETAMAGATGGRVYRGGCARNLQDLVFEITTAIDARDANRLASVYHWAGMSGANGYAVWNRLDAVAQRPLVDIAPVLPAAPEPSLPPPPIAVDAEVSVPDGTTAGPISVEPGTNKPADATGNGDYYPQTTVRRTPIGLRLEQTLGKTGTPSRTMFWLTRHFDCWWVHF